MKNSFTLLAFSLLLVGFILLPELVQAADPVIALTCEDMLRPHAFRKKQQAELKRWNAANSPKTLQAQSSSNDSGLSLWLAAHDAILQSIDEARSEHRRQYTEACRDGAILNFNISPKFTVGIHPESTKRMRVRRPVASRTVGNTGGSKVTSTTDWVQTGGRGIARSREYLSPRTRRATFRTTAPKGRPCSKSGKQARLSCASKE